MPVRRLSAEALLSRSPAVGADRVGLGPGLIEDEAGRINRSLMLLQLALLRATSGRPLAFFEADPFESEEPPDGTDPDRNVAVREPLLDLVRSSCAATSFPASGHDRCGEAANSHSQLQIELNYFERTTLHHRFELPKVKARPCIAGLTLGNGVKMPGTFASPFVSSSLWNTPIDELDPIYSDPGSIEDVQFRDTGLANTWASFENIVYDTPANAPLVKWTYDVLNQTPEGGTFTTNGTIQLPTPTNIDFGNGSDGWAIFSDPDGVHYWEVWEGSYNSTTMTYHATYMVEGNYVTGTGWGQNGIGAGIRASGASLLGGIVTQAELNNLSIPHALAMELAPAQLEAGTAPSGQFVYPAVSADTGSVGTYTGTIPMGAHFALPAKLDLADAGLNPEGLALAEAYQTYGGYVVDSAAYTDSLAQIESGTTQQDNEIFADLNWIRDHLVLVSTPTLIQTNGSTSLVQNANEYFLYGAEAVGPVLKYRGSAVTAGEFGGWTPIGAIQTSTGYKIAWKDGASFSIWTTNSSGNYISGSGSLSGSSYALESLEQTFHHDLNGDGTIGLVRTSIQTDGSTSLTEVANNYFLYAAGGSSGPEFKYGGSAVTAGEFAGCTPIGAIQTSTGYEIAWKDGASFSIWTTNSSGNYISGSGGLSDSSTALESLETTFHQDLNGDGKIGLVTRVIRTNGSTSLAEVANNYFLYGAGASSGPELKYGGSAVTVGEFAGSTPIGAIQTSTGYEIAWKHGANYSIWTTNGSGNYVSGSVLSGSSYALESLEQTFHQNLNGDGTIGLVTAVIQTDGSTSLAEVANNYFLYTAGGSSGPGLKYGGSAVTAGEFAGCTPIGAIQTSTGYEIAWKDGTSFSIWTTNSGGNYISGSGSLSGSSTALKSLEQSFHQDLNGDGVINNPTTVIDVKGHIDLSLNSVTQPATIAAGSTLELPGSDSGSVTFKASTGALILDHSSTFTGQIIGLAGNGNLATSDQVDLKDISFGAGTTDSFTGTSEGGTLTITDAQHQTANISLVGDYVGSTFALSSDGNGGTVVVDPPAQDVVSGAISFSDLGPGTLAVAVSAENGGLGYVGDFTADVVKVANRLEDVGWNFNFASNSNQTVTQSYVISVGNGSGSAVSQKISVTSAGPGNVSFIFHPGIGTDTIVNANTADTFELDGFSSVVSNSQLATLLHEAQTGQSQSLFQSVNSGHDTLINLGTHDTITLANINLADLHASNFIIA